MAQVWPRLGEMSSAHGIVLLAVADVVNDVNDNLFWMPTERLAEKAGVSRSTAAAAQAAFVRDGWLEVVTPAAGSRRAEYRWSGFCVQISDTTPEVVSEDRTLVSKPRTLVSKPADSRPSLNAREPKGTQRARDFAAVWAIYPRKLNRKGAEKAWTARVRSGVDPADLHRATENYARLRDGEDPSTTMHAATFFGPNDRWADYLGPALEEAKPRRKESRGERNLRLLQERRAARAIG